MLLSIVLAAATAAASPPRVSTNAGWDQLPTAETIERYYPPLAQLENLSGRAVIACAIQVNGSATDCSVVQETPPARGFGAAAVTMASTFRMKPATEDGAPVGGVRVNIPIVFNAANPPFPTAYNCYAAFSGATDADVEQFRTSAAEELSIEVGKVGGLSGDAERLMAGARRDASEQTPEMQNQCRAWLANRAAVAVYKAIALPLSSAFTAAIERNYPEPAQYLQIKGQVVVHCIVTETGGVDECTLISETPTGFGFGDLSLKFMPLFKVKLKNAAGQSTAGASVAIPLNFGVK